MHLLYSTLFHTKFLMYLFVVVPSKIMKTFSRIVRSRPQVYSLRSRCSAVSDLQMKYDPMLFCFLRVNKSISKPSTRSSVLRSSTLAMTGCCCSAEISGLNAINCDSMCLSTCSTSPTVDLFSSASTCTKTGSTRKHENSQDEALKYDNTTETYKEYYC
jgi:hypothetical protein